MIPFFSPYLLPSDGVALDGQLNTGFIGPGLKTREFTETLREYVGAKHVLLTTSGTMALSTAARASVLHLGKIVVPAYGVAATANAFACFGYKLVLADINRQTGCIDLDTVTEAVKQKPQAICYVNFSGNTNQSLIELRHYCDDNGVILIEDAACAFGQKFHDKAAGTFGHVGTYSFSVPKILTTGQGGAVITDDPELFRWADGFIDHGGGDWRETNLHTDIGLNLRFNDILASLGLAQLERIETILNKKNKLFGILREGLDDKIFRVQGGQSPLHNIVFCEEPDKLVSYLRSEHIDARRQYRTISQHLCYQKLGYGRSFPNADWWTNHAVYLPFGLGMMEFNAQHIVDVLMRFGLDRLVTP